MHCLGTWFLQIKGHVDVEHLFLVTKWKSAQYAQSALSAVYNLQSAHDPAFTRKVPNGLLASINQIFEQNRED